MCRIEAVLVVPQPHDDPSIIFSACADGHVLRWEVDTDLNADSYKWVAPCLLITLPYWVGMAPVPLPMSARPSMCCNAATDNKMLLTVNTQGVNKGHTYLTWLATAKRKSRYKLHSA